MQYVFEDGSTIDFQNEWNQEEKKAQEKEKAEEKEKEEEKNCLITKEPLVEGYVVLDCNHTFNYLPLYKDLVNHKQKFSMLETDYLHSHQIRCPYCRSKQSKLLPYFATKGVKHMHGINFLDPTIYSEISLVKIGVCHYSSLYSKALPCTNNKVFEIQDGKTYCIYHKYYAIKIWQKANKEKCKQEKKKLIQEEKQKAKELVKAKALEVKLAKMQAKAEDKKKPTMLASVCQQILITGKNKGCICHINMFQDNLCKRHYHLLEKKMQKQEQK